MDNLTLEETIQLVTLFEVGIKNCRISNDGKLLNKSIIKKLDNNIKKLNK
tara:strand:- start:80215 stop:80364 length:150 start_codon:yes stop_codon:yes gene_type:complete